MHSSVPAFGEDVAVGAPLPRRQVELLPFIRLPDHAIGGNWKQLQDSASCEPDDDSVLLLPAVLRGSCRLTIDFTQRTPGTVSVSFPIDPGRLQVVVSGGDTGVTLSQRHTAEIDVSTRRANAKVVAKVDGKPFSSWSGAITEFRLPKGRAVPNHHAPAIHVWGAVVDIHRFALEVHGDGESYLLGEEWEDPLKLVHDAPSKEIARQCVTFKGRKYFMSRTPLVFSAAQELATKLRGRIVTVSSREEEEFLREQARGIPFWLSAWRRSSSTDWRDGRNRPLSYKGGNGLSVDNIGGNQVQLGVFTDSDHPDSVFSDFDSNDKRLHACIEWGDE